eukprot:CAMPEP_0175817368 /NCGR_PEP_ID=MMETSP0107_2-20121207/6975_1 /TAXON_ID=195067 ORGANISM="Goniomonas pacifica, Strain CCMP1869" /NCGR_SAMPLE_ID=MMETSP0107_2 /ASSEMBLY_ACC=CAM_ASM_000203 /LENGTH=33 /DNA_ID= /DNA_START= /DNA_END= /DNA_ORIENTATION=
MLVKRMAFGFEVGYLGMVARVASSHVDGDVATI